MRIAADRSRCEGHGLCEEAAPDVYTVGDDGFVTVADDFVPADLERAAEAGARVCPVAAIRVLVA